MRKPQAIQKKSAALAGEIGIEVYVLQQRYVAMLWDVSPVDSLMNALLVRCESHAGLSHGGEIPSRAAVSCPDVAWFSESRDEPGGGPDLGGVARLRGLRLAGDPSGELG